MVISFSSENARRQLLGKGEVYTFRKNRRKRIGKDWANIGRGQPKLCDVIIEEIGDYTLGELDPFLPWSGFESLYDWHGEIFKLNKGEWYSNQVGWLYKVTLLQDCQKSETS